MNNYTVSYTFAPGNAIYAVDTEKYWVKPGQVDGVEIDIFTNQTNITYWIKFNNAQGSRGVNERQAFSTAAQAFNYISTFFAGVTQTPAITPAITPANSLTPSTTQTITPSNTLTFTPSTTATISPTPSNTTTVTPTNTATPSITPSTTATVTPSTTVTISLTPSNTATVTPTNAVTPSITPSVS